MGVSRLPRDAKLPNPCRETNVSGANGDREILIFPVQPTTSRIGNLTRLIHTLLAICGDHTQEQTTCVVNQFWRYIQCAQYILKSVA